MENKIMTVDQMLSTIVGGGTVADSDIKRASYGVEGYELCFGYGGCTRENISEYLAALGGLRDRLRAMNAARAPLTESQIQAANRVQEAADLEAAAQDADDRDQMGHASTLRAKARALLAVR